MKSRSPCDTSTQYVYAATPAPLYTVVEAACYVGQRNVVAFIEWL